MNGKENGTENRQLHIQKKNTQIKWIEKAAAITAAFFVWEICALLLDQKILLAGPVDVLQVLVLLIWEASFWETICFSLLRIALGFAIGVLLGCFLAVLSGRFRYIEVFLWPYLEVIKSTPVASVIVLCLVWFSSRNISVLISFFIVFPVVYMNVLSGIRNMDEKMEEMADVYGLGSMERLLYVRLPQLKSYLMPALQLSCGMAWKSGIAAEVIGIPAGSIGRQLYDAKLYLASPELFAWTFVLICVSVLFEKAVMWMVEQLLALPRRRLK